MENQESGRVAAFIKESITFRLKWFLIHILFCVIINLFQFLGKIL